MKNFNSLVFIFILIIVLSNSFKSNAQDIKSISQKPKIGVVSKIIEQNKVSQNQIYQKIEVTIKKDGSKVVVQNGLTNGVKNQIYKLGDKVLLSSFQISNSQVEYIIIDHIRTDSIIILFSLFIFLSILIAGKIAFRSFISMAITFVVIFTILLPQISQGFNPLISILIFSFISVPINYYLSHGINFKTTSAVIGTFVSLIFTIIIATFFVDFANLTGFTNDESMFLQISKGADFNVKGILLAGIIIGIVGILDDITISQASIVYQLKYANKKLNFLELFKRSMEVGKDHISSLINTLVLVYTGAFLPLLLLFIDSSKTLSEVLNYEIVANEVIRTLIGSIGLVIAVPITTIVTAISTEFLIPKKINPDL